MVFISPSVLALSISSSVNKTISGISTEEVADLDVFDELLDLLSEVDDFSTLLEEAFESLLDDSEEFYQNMLLTLQQTKEPHRL